MGKSPGRGSITGFHWHGRWKLQLYPKCAIHCVSSTLYIIYIALRKKKHLHFRHKQGCRSRQRHLVAVTLFTTSSNVAVCLFSSAFTLITWLQWLSPPPCSTISLICHTKSMTLLLILRSFRLGRCLTLSGLVMVTIAPVPDDLFTEKYIQMKTKLVIRM